MRKKKIRLTTSYMVRVSKKDEAMLGAINWRKTDLSRLRVAVITYLRRHNYGPAFDGDEETMAAHPFKRLVESASEKFGFDTPAELCRYAIRWHYEEHINAVPSALELAHATERPLPDSMTYADGDGNVLWAISMRPTTEEKK